MKGAEIIMENKNIGEAAQLSEEDIKKYGLDNVSYADEEVQLLFDTLIEAKKMFASGVSENDAFSQFFELKTEIDKSLSTVSYDEIEDYIQLAADSLTEKVTDFNYHYGLLPGNISLSDLHLKSTRDELTAALQNLKSENSQNLYNSPLTDIRISEINTILSDIENLNTLYDIPAPTIELEPDQKEMQRIDLIISDISAFTGISSKQLQALPDDVREELINTYSNGIGVIGNEDLMAHISAIFEMKPQQEEKFNPLAKTEELIEANCNQIDGIINNLPNNEERPSVLEKLSFFKAEKESTGKEVVPYYSHKEHMEIKM